MIEAPGNIMIKLDLGQAIHKLWPMGKPAESYPEGRQYRLLMRRGTAGDYVIDALLDVDWARIFNQGSGCHPTFQCRPRIG